MCGSAASDWAILVTSDRWAKVFQNYALTMDLAIGSTSFSEERH